MRARVGTPRAAVSALVLLLATFGVDAAAPPGAAAARFQLNGSGTLNRSAGAAVQGAAGLRLSARLQASSATSKSQAAGGFTLAANLAAAPLGCSSDTIFMNGFDN